MHFNNPCFATETPKSELLDEILTARHAGAVSLGGFMHACLHEHPGHLLPPFPLRQDLLINLLKMKQLSSCNT